MDQAQYNQSLFSFLRSSPTPYQATGTLAGFLRQHGFNELQESSRWQLEQGSSYFVVREESATIAFTLGSEEQVEQGFRMLAAHTDSPCLQIKPQPDVKTGTYHQLGVEVYGGPLLTTWFDRDLCLAGRAVCSSADQGLVVLPVDFKRPLLTIPSLAIHFNREANAGTNIDKQKHLPPIIAQAVNKQLPQFHTLLIEQLQLEHPETRIDHILAFDLFCYDFQGPGYLGLNQEFISSGRLDNLLSCHAGLMALTHADRRKNTLLFCANHEENGSTSATGAQGSFIDSVVDRLTDGGESRHISLNNSFLISMDNAHAAHPNFMDKMDPGHEIHLNQGPVIKINSNQRYATSSLSAAVYKDICRKAGVSPQEFVMRSDLPCGSTIGPLTAARLGIRTIDIGAPTLAMHSIRELTGSSDPFLLFRSVSRFLHTDSHKKISEIR